MLNFYRWSLFWGLFLSLVLIFPQNPVLADICRSQDGHHWCLDAVKRSAKYPWEYRASLRIDGVLQADSILYNCRDWVKIGTDGYANPFEVNGLGKKLCRALKF